METLPADSAPQKFLEQTIARSTEVLGAYGQYCAKSGQLQSDGTSIAIHTDYGPTEQDKDVNQDYIIAWAGSGAATGISPVRWAIAMADGVSSSYFAELGAELACWVAIEKLVGGREPPEIVARRAVDSAGEAIVNLAKCVEEGGRRFRPPGVFRSSWEYMFRKGLLLQTTLTLAWMAQGKCYFAVVGDAGITMWPRHGPPEPQILTAPDLESNLVHALGPRNPRIIEWDYFDHREVSECAEITLCTDGIGRLMFGDEDRLTARAKSACSKDPAENDAETVVKWTLDSHGAAIDDNVTLAVVSLNST